MEQLVSQGAGRINGAYGEADWTPIRYVNQGYPREALSGFYRAADISLITPLRDGMNLVAKEFVAAQDPADPGVLILSRFAGAAHQLKEALLVNPYDTEAVAAAINRALSMPLAERRERHAAMYETLVRNDISHWAERFMSTLSRPRAARWPFDLGTAAE
jgi:trehalose 6-phosphate synthase